MTTGELLERWREATRAAEIAERLAALAEASVARADRDAIAAHEIAQLAQRAAKYAERTARIAREAAERAMSFAAENRDRDLVEAELALTTTRAEERAARDRFQDAEAAAWGPLTPEATATAEA
jgi:hypothetical protein